MEIFDAHFHILDPRYLLFENNGYLPQPFTIEEYFDQKNELRITGGCIVSSSFQGFDQEYLIDSLTQLGSNFYGVANIPFNSSKDELEKLNKSGVVGVRYNFKRGVSESMKNLEQLSRKLFDEYNWHTELYIDSRDLKELYFLLKNLPAFTIDHLGLSKDGLNDLYSWVEKGIKVKATGFDRIDFDPIPVMQKIYSINPDALMFGSDLPSTRTKVPFSKNDIELIKNNFSENEQKRILFENAYEWYNKKAK